MPNILAEYGLEANQFILDVHVVVQYLRNVTVTSNFNGHFNIRVRGALSFWDGDESRFCLRGGDGQERVLVYGRHGERYAEDRVRWVDRIGDDSVMVWM